MNVNTDYYRREQEYWDARGNEAYQSLSPFDQGRIKRWISLTRADRDCLDLGGGSGMAASLLDQHHDGIVACVDISHGLLRHAQCPAVQGDALRMPFADQSFDLVIAAAFFHHIPGREPDAFKECARVLRPGGRIVGYDPNARSIQNRIFMGDGPLRLAMFSPDERPIQPRNLSLWLTESGFSTPDMQLFSFRNAKLTVFEIIQRYALNPLSLGPLKPWLQRWFFWTANRLTD